MRGKKKCKTGGRKPKLAEGALLDQYGVPQQQGALVGYVPPAEQKNIGGGIGKGAATGASLGSSFGPIGTVVGGVVGAIGGGIGTAIGNRKRQREYDQQLLEQQNIAQYNLQQQSFANAGNKLAKGGTLNRISPDAVEVRANEPSKTDSVELDTAFVDHNEIIDNQNRVFSDVLKTPKGKTIAKEAKRLEKMKSNNPRFIEADTHIDNKLTKLFEYQESKKRNKTKRNLALGGNLTDPGKKNKKKNISSATGLELPETFETTPRNIDVTKPIVKGVESFDYLEDRTKSQYASKPMSSFRSEQEYLKYHKGIFEKSLTPEERQRYDAMDESTREGYFTAKYGTQPFVGQDRTAFAPEGNVLGRPAMTKGGKLPKPKYFNGNNDDYTLGIKPLSSEKIYNDLIGPNLTVNTAIGDAIQPISTEQPQRQGLSGESILQGATALASFIPNIANRKLRNNLKGPIAPVMESKTRLERISARPQLASANRAYNQSKGVIEAGTAQGSNLASATGNLLAKRLAGENAIYGNVNAANAQIQAQEAGMNLGVGARNVERSNRFNTDKIDFANRKTQLQSENIANAIQKFQSITAERNRMNLDKDKYDILMEAYGDLPEAMKEQYRTFMQNAKPKNSKGGKLNTKRKGKGIAY